MTIGGLARKAGIPVSTVRFYEKRGLLEQPARTNSGYRIYEEGDVAKVRFIKRAQELGFTLQELKGLLSLSDKQDISRETALTIGTQKLSEIHAKLRDLKRMQTAIETLLRATEVDPKAPCPIVQSLS